MRLIRKTLLALSLALLACLCFPSLGQASSQAPVLIERVLMKIGSDAFTQRDLEIYCNIKNALRADDGLAIQLVNEGNWSDSLKQFEKDMTIGLEIKSLSQRYSPDKRLQMAVSKLKAAEAKDAAFRTMLSRLFVDEGDFERTATAILQVEDFIAFKQKTAQSDWLDSLSKKFKVLVFDDSRQYRAISPVDSGKKSVNDATK